MCYRQISCQSYCCKRLWVRTQCWVEFWNLWPNVVTFGSTSVLQVLVTWEPSLLWICENIGEPRVHVSSLITCQMTPVKNHDCFWQVWPITTIKCPGNSSITVETTEGDTLWLLGLDPLDLFSTYIYFYKLLYDLSTILTVISTIFWWLSEIALLVLRYGHVTRCSEDSG